MRDYKNDFSSEDNLSPLLPGHCRGTAAQRSALLDLSDAAEPRRDKLLNLDDNAYKARRQKLAVCMTARRYPEQRLFGSLVPEPLFNDNDHLMAEGNRKLADALAQEIAPRIQQPNQRERKAAPPCQADSMRVW